MSSLAEYKITFHRTPIGFWAWRGVTPDGTTFRSPLGGAFVGKDGAERDALREIHRLDAREVVDGDELARRVAERTATLKAT